MTINLYDKVFYENQRDASRAAARAVVPTLLEAFPIRSVCDIGCGVGTWLRVFLEAGITVTGMDGAYVRSDMLEIPQEHFIATDLGLPIAIDRDFDLAISLEVAEHLPAERAENFVFDLTRLAPIILFSAAIPRQGGVGHVNEQWQDYWADLFYKHDYFPLDIIRPKIWNDKTIPFWYRQNTILYASKTFLENRGENDSGKDTYRNLLSVVHPELYESLLDNPGLRLMLKRFVPSLVTAVSKRLFKA